MKQLMVLLVVAMWVSFMFLDAWDSYRPGEDWYWPVRAAMTMAFVRSLPAVLFGGILFWWFGKKGESK